MVFFDRYSICASGMLRVSLRVICFGEKFVANPKLGETLLVESR